VYYRFQNRAQAGRFLADNLKAYAGREDVVVLGLPRGGVPVAFEVARELHAPLAAFLVRKLGVPRHEELAMGAIASGGVCFFNTQLIEKLQIPQRMIDEVVARERQELERRERLYQISPIPDLRDRIVILVDDGLATGASMRAAVIAAREYHPARLVVAAPVAAQETYREFQRAADEIVCVQTPEQFDGVGQWYEDFSQTTDEEVRYLLEEGSKFRAASPEKILQKEKS
jgi:putative phosphoribosyl transferase